MQSLTYWNRLEPRPRSYSVECGLTARIRDPLWMLARQEQFQEFHGEDAGTPAHVEISASISKIIGPLKNGDAPTGIEIGRKPIDVLIEDEPFAPDISVKVELGQIFEALLAQNMAKSKISVSDIGNLIGKFRDAYPLELPSEGELNAMNDQEAARFLRVCAGRAIDGLKLYKDTIASLPSLPSKPTIDPKLQDEVKSSLEGFVLWVKDVFRDIGLEDPSDWKPERLEYSSRIAAVAVDGGPATLSADLDSTGDLDWYAFEMERERPSWTPPQGSVRTFNDSIVPAHVKFKGMPNHKWWDFEKWTTDFGDIRPDKQDIARLVVMDFMLVHGIDWFVMPFDQEVGTLCNVNSLVVKDVFGDLTLIERADSPKALGGGSWTIFSTSIQGETPEVADFFVLSPSASIARQMGPVIEDVRFLRDEAANMAWCVEHITEDGIGQPWSGYERSHAAASSQPPDQEPSDGSAAPLRYMLQTVVPENWIPFLPISIDPSKGKFALQRSAMIGDSGESVLIDPSGRILKPTNLPAGEKLYKIFEEEVPRSGVRVYRERCRSRWTDGSTHIWIDRRKAASTGEGSSGLKFDLAISKIPKKATLGT